MIHATPKKPGKPKAAGKPGAEPDVLKLDGNWIDNVRKSFQ